MFTGDVMMKKVSLIVPCYNEEEALPIFAAELDKVVQGLGSYEFEVLMVNDGSSDGTLKVMKDVSSEYEYFKYISFSRNFGKESAMYAGFCNASLQTHEVGDEGCYSVDVRVQQIFKGNLWVDRI